MGVYGLATYLREKQRFLSTTIVLSSQSSPKQSIPIVVDGWSFIYDLYNNSNIPWVYGGEYSEFTNLVKTVVQAWIKAGVQVYFVFDGACPDLKFPTVISRLSQSHIQPAQLFFRTSTASRSTGRFLSETRILPPLAYSACIHALETLRSVTNNLELHFADEEGDPYAVELAGRIGGYVVGNDSDFVILNADGYLGYIPLSEMVWQIPDSFQDVESMNGDDGEFQTVRKPKAKRKVLNDARFSGGLAPPDNMPELSLAVVAYSPETLAKHLNIPVSLLPLLGALVGNDFSKDSESNSRKIQALFFDRQLTLIQRIEKVANTIHSVISPGAQRRKAKHQVGSVMDLIDRTVNALLGRLTTTMGTGEIEDIVDKIVNATLQYAIPKYGGDVGGREGLWSTSFCALHDPETCSLLPMISRKVMRQAEDSTQKAPDLLEAREKYLDVYRSGLLPPKLMDALNTGSYWPRLFLENPDLETVGRSIGKPIREWTVAILEDTVGLPAAGHEDDEGSVGKEEEEADDDELVDVVESDGEGSTTDFLAPLKGELHRLHSLEDEIATEPPASVSSHRHRPSGPPVITEYLRKGTRIASENIVVTPISDLLISISLSEYVTDGSPPLVLISVEDRLVVFLRALASDSPSVRRLSPDNLLPVLAVRWIVHTLHHRWQESGSKEREKERWTKNEARCWLSSILWTSDDQSQSESTGIKPDLPPIEDRNIQLMAQILMALDSIEQLSQALLLTERVPFDASRLSGRRFHAMLTGTTAITQPLPSGIWDSTEDGLSDAFQEERVKKVKRSKAEKQAVASVSNGKASAQAVPKKGFKFALLGDMEA
ncbi:PIN domain-like protein [Phlegmacium glaucopus]|nr:PIN domain-like protein [Phlegmacium glaucopus]